jgi:chemotaxis family two-component system sensor kinase Cph1
MATLTEPVNLTNCDTEPIHIPGSIQPHGFLLALDPATLEVKQASRNAEDYLGRTLDEITGQTLPAMLGELGRQIEEQVSPERLSGSSKYLLTAPTGPEGAYFEIVAHRLDHAVIVEFERLFEDLDMERLHVELYNFVSQLREYDSAQQVWDATVKQVRKFTGYDRVMLYRFDAEGHGTVIAEDRNDRLPSYLDLRFPASDIPRQARRLYEINRMRIIPDVDYEPSPILPGAPLDLSGSVLRSVSPIHRDYMRNMGTAASMSISILFEGKLWGLISCHNRDARHVPFRMRSSCDLIAQVMTSQLETQIKTDRFSRALALKGVQQRLLTYMASEENYMDGVTLHPDELLNLTGSSGAAVVIGKQIFLFGKTPAEVQVQRLTTWLQKNQAHDIYVSDCVQQDYAPAKSFASVASGVIAVSISKFNEAYVLWFRPEVVETVRWAGDPQKPAVEEGRLPVHPRSSFDIWLQIVRGRSLPWSAEEVSAVTDFRAAVLEIVLSRAEELASLAADLKLANKELEAFSYSVSHDLRAPFRHISGFAELLREEESGHMSERGQHYISTIIDSARFAGLLVDSLLNFSRIARTRLDLNLIDMTMLFREEWEDVARDEGKGRKIAFVCENLPAALADAALIRQVVRNLLSNAAKYTRENPDARVEVTATEAAREVTYRIADNGVGFDQQYVNKLFGVFQRLHRFEDFEGTGVGLANVRRIISRHGGQTWAEGEPGKGARFYFTLPRVKQSGGE